MKRSPYPHYDVLAEAGHWDDRTQEVVRRRVQEVPPYRFFDNEEAARLEAVCERVIPQEDRAPAERIPIAPFIDQALEADETDGFRQPDVPWPQEAWRLGLRGIEEASRATFDRGFSDLGQDQRDQVLGAVQRGEVSGGAWDALPPEKFFKQLVQQVITVYYAHPKAWSEIGWGGPASPRGYVRTGYGRRDPWEPDERGQASSVELVRRREERQSTASGTGGATH
ncbi:MAG: gluconate 2-dehydrogenase subunit 3 family protein [Actinobacteria bacterium]|nr:gluconate 2-dehydrogenase subunit 3 family protein [Actinomycetota bacterium]